MAPPMDQRMRRRDFLTSTAGGALGWPLAVWVAACDHADAGSPQDDGEPAPWKAAAEAERLRAAAQAAHERQEPLLILVLPADALRRHEHGRVWGAFVLRGPPRAVAALATCTLVCVRNEAVRAVLGRTGIVLPDGDCAALVLEPGARTARGLSADLACEPRSFPRSEAEAELRAHLERLGSALEGAIAPSPAVLDRRLRSAAAARRLDVAFGAPLFHVELADRVRGELQAAPPPGTAWATLEPCGMRVDHPLYRPVSGPCGTAVMPPLSRRFLFYLVDLEPR